MGHSTITNLSNLDYFIVNTTVDITSVDTTYENGVDKTNFDRMIEIINIHGQPVLMSSITGSGPYIFKFATEHKGAFSAATIQNSFDLHGVSFGFSSNTTVSQASGL